MLTIAVAMQNAYANNVFIDNIWYRDYLDFAQNKGIFKPGATGLELVQKDGSVFKLPDLPFPDFSAVSSKGTTTSIGGAYVVTAAHNEKWQENGRPSHHSIKSQTWGNTTYRWEGSRSHGDFAVQRLNKFVVETEGFDGVEIPQNQENWKKLHERYGIDVNGKRKVIMFRIGSGNAQITMNGSTSNLGFANENGWLTGTIFELEKWGAGWSDKFPFKNNTTGGDSGSAWFVYDGIEKKWVILGTHYGVTSLPTQSLYNPWNNGAVSNIKNAFTVNVALDGRSGAFGDDNAFTVEGSSFATAKKDLSLTGGGTLQLTSNLDMGIGGLIFDKNQRYKVEGDGLTYKGAGVDIGEGTTVEWNVKGAANDNLHKIGKGTLKVNVAQGNNLKTGNGTVELNAERAFNAIYITSGKATVRLNAENALAGGDYGGIFFAANGGTLDLNGHDFTVKKIAAADSGAVITNSSSTKSTVTINAQDKYAYHGTLTGRLDLNYRHEQRPADGFIVLDGGADIEGDINVKAGKLVMMGHATTHAVMTQCANALMCSPPPADRVQNAERNDAVATGKEYMISNTVSDFRQPDWETRKYKFETLNLNNAELHVGRNAIVEGAVRASGSTLTFGGAGDVYLDRHDGLNITGEGFGFQQNIVGGQSRADDTLLYIGDITAENRTSISSWMPYMEASLALSGGSSFSAHGESTVKLRAGGIRVSGGSSLILNDILVEDLSDAVIEASDDSTLSIRNVFAKNGSVSLAGRGVSDALLAYDGGVINVGQWELRNGNLETQDSGVVNIGVLRTRGAQTAAANLTISDRLIMSDLNHRPAADAASSWVGLSANRITLKKDAKVSASFTNDFLSLRNIAYGTRYTLIEALDLQDHRADERIEFTLEGDGNVVKSGRDNNKIVFEFAQKEDALPQPPVPEPEPQPPVIPPVDPAPPVTPEIPSPDPETPNPETPDPEAPNPDARPQPGAIQKAFLEQRNPHEGALYQAMLEHNKQGGPVYQEVAIADALSMGTVTDGVNALAAIVERTDRMFAETARTISQSRMIQPARTAIDARLSSLRAPVRQTSASHYPLAFAGGDLSAIGRAMDADALHRSVFADVSGGYQKDGDRTDRMVSTHFGYDRLLRIDGDLVVFGGALSITELNNQDGDANDDGRMYALSGYVSREGARGLGFQSYLTLGQLRNSRSFAPEISLDRQTFDEKTWVAMSSNYLKYRFDLGSVAVKPMLLADVGWSHTGGSESTYLKRESLTDAAIDLGLGFEIERMSDETSWMLQFTARRNVWRSADAVGVNLKNAQGFISYGLDDRKSTTFAAHGMVSQRLTKTMMMDWSIGGSASTDGALGVNGNARLRWMF